MSSRHRACGLALSIAVSAGAASACATGRAAATPTPFPSAHGPLVTPAASTSAVDQVVRTALALRGTRYRLGGQDPNRGLDCSGLVQYVFGQFSIPVPRTVDEQFGAGHVIDFAQIRAGDLLFFATTRAGLESGSATHVGIAIGPPSLGEFVHAPGSGGAVRIDRFDAPYWRARWVGARRLF